jgi:predicted Zn-dependent peptidase
MSTPRLHRLGNGVTVVCDPMDGLESFALSAVAGRGARFEPPDRSGWSHLLEHMVFKGAAGRSARDIVEAVEREGGMINAATGYERTSFQVRGLKGRLPLGMRIVSDLMLRPTLDEAELEREKDVVAQEIAEAADTPDDHVFELAQGAAFHGQPLGRPILGAPEVMRSATPALLEDWRARIYAPDQLVVSASGAVDEDELLALAEACFGDAAGPSTPAPDPGRFVGGLRPTARRLEQAHLVFLVPAPGARDDDYYAMRLFAEALGGGMSSRLFQEAREKLGLAYAVDAWADAYTDVGMLGIYAGAAADNASALARTAADQIRALAERIEPDELDRAKAQVKSHLLMAREAPLMRAEQAAGQTLLFGRLFSSAEIVEAIEAVELSGMKKLGERLLGPRTCAAAVLGAKAALAAAEGFDRALLG